MLKEAKMLNIIKFEQLEDKETFIKGVEDGTLWDYPFEEIDYLLEEHSNELFTIYNGRLWETHLEII